MIPWEFIDKAEVPGEGDELLLYKRGEEYSIRTAGTELMNSRMHGSEDALAEITCEKISGRENPKILIGGLGMGFTLSAALKSIDEESQIVVAELVPAVVKWNREIFGHLAGHPLNDRRVSVSKGDVADIIKTEKNSFDAILLDVDNGPDGLTRNENDRIYSKSGLGAAYKALKPSGILAVWSSGADEAFTRRLKNSGFSVDVVNVRARKSKKGGRHTIWFARRK